MSPELTLAASDQRHPTTLEFVACPLCAARGARPLLRGKDYFFHLPGEFALVMCKACGLVFQNPRPDAASIPAFYPDQYGSYASAQGGLAARRGVAGRLIRRALYRRCRLIDEAVAARSTPRRLLDIGCASGLFLEAMQHYPGWQVEGVELHVPSARAVAQRLGIPVFAGPFEQAQFGTGDFDAVTLWDVLEHVHDPLATLHEVRRIVRPGGVLFVRVPNAASYVARLGGRYWSGYDMPRHMTMFSPRTLSHMLALAGFHDALQVFPSGSYIASAHSVRFWLGDWGAPAGLAAGVQRVLLHPALRALAAPVTWVADRLLGGSNVEALVR